MSLLGFNALGRLALGQLPSNTTGPSFSKFDAPLRKVGLAAAVVATTFVGFVPPPAKAAPPVFTAFSQPAPAGRVPACLQPQPLFVGDLGPASTPRSLVFTKFSEPSFSRTYKVEQHPEVRFRILRPDAATPGPLVFTKFSEPPPIRRLAAHLHTQPVFEVTRVILAVTPTSLTFTRFSEPNPSKKYPSYLQDADVSAEFFLETAATPVVVGGDFSAFDLPPKIKRAAQESFTSTPFVLPNLALLGDDFSEFEPPPKLRQPQQGFTNAPIFLGPASTPDRLATFTDFGIPTRIHKTYQYGFTNAPQPPLVQSVVFGTFDQPQLKKPAPFDQSVQFTITPPVVAVFVQPYLFSPFEQPSFKRAPQFDAAVQFQIVPPPAVISVVTFTGFSDFAVPQVNRGNLTTEQPSTLFEVLPPQPQITVFARFSEPHRARPAITGFTNAPLTASIQNYVFSRFEQPQFKRSVVLDPSVQFEIFPPVVAIAATPSAFTGFMSFDIPQLVGRPVGQRFSTDGVVMTLNTPQVADIPGLDDWIIWGRRRGRR